MACATLVVAVVLVSLGAQATPDGSSNGSNGSNDGEARLWDCVGAAACHEAFVSGFGAAYGYGGVLEPLVARELQRLGGDVYADYTGSSLYLASQVEAVAGELTSTAFGNPHSASPSSLRSTDAVDDARAEVLAFFGVTEATHSVVFTSGATAALKLVGGAFPWSAKSEFAFTVVNHNSVGRCRCG